MAELPSGTVTFLFTDVEGSTRLLKQLRDRYGDVLADHRRILRAAFAEYDGQEIDTQGDAFFVAFRKATDAALAAAAAQRGLAAHTWPDGTDVRVRMGIHTGEPNVGDEGYHGLGVHRAARIMAAGHGGQVLLSQATCSVLEDDELPGSRGPRPRLASPQGSRPAGAHVPARHRRAPRRVPAASHGRCSDGVHGPRGRVGTGSERGRLAGATPDPALARGRSRRAARSRRLDHGARGAARKLGRELAASSIRTPSA